MPNVNVLKQPERLESLGVSERMEHLAREAKEKAKTALEATGRTIRENPVASVLVGVGTGFLLGALTSTLRSRSHRSSSNTTSGPSGR